MAGKTWLLEAVIGSDKRLAGRWTQIGNPRDTGPFIGLIASPDRIDGIWSACMSDRWDFRGRLPASNLRRTPQVRIRRGFSVSRNTQAGSDTPIFRLGNAT